jgi:cephalosporin hydroxylase
MSESQRFLEEVRKNVKGLREDHDVQALSRIWLREITRHRYAYNFSWMGRPIIQFPQDMIAMQEIIWQIKPHLIIETGIAHGGSIIYYASLLEMMNIDGYVLGIDIDIREHNREAIESHPVSSRIRMLEGSSVSDDIVAAAKEQAAGKENVLVVLDSNHTHEHVLAELNAYGPLVTAGSYMVVFDTLLEYMPDDLVVDRNWGTGNNPGSAVREFLEQSDLFEIDRDIESKLLITVAPGGYLRRREG